MVWSSETSIIEGSNRNYPAHQLHRHLEANLRSSNCGYKTATINGEHKNTYDQLNNTANRIAAYLLNQINERELKPNQDGDWIIAVCMPPSNELIITLLAILKTGAAYLPIDSTFPKDRIDHILLEAKPIFVIYDDNVDVRSLFNGTAMCSYGECEALSSNYDHVNILDDQMLQTRCDNCVALVLYTSGSTGVPKGVRLSHSSLMNRLQWQWETFPYSSTEQICVFKTSLTFGDSIAEIWSPLLTCRTVLILPKCLTKDPTQLVSILHEYEIERLVLVPTLLKSILLSLSLQQNVGLLKKLKLWVCSGETLPLSLAIEFFDYFPENEYSLCNFYGSTEIMADVTYFICGGKDQLQNFDSVPIGRPIFNTTIYILDADRKPIEVGETGELFVSGANLAVGYVNGRDKERFIENPMAVDGSQHSRLYRTSDYASIHDDGIIRYKGRMDSQVKIRGHRVDLNEIEKYLMEIDGVQKGKVLCHHVGQMDQTILAFTVIQPNAHLNALEIELFLREKLLEYMLPQVIIIDKLPMLTSGKIDQLSLLQMFENKNEKGDSETSIHHYTFDGIPQNDLQKAKVLFEVISEVMGTYSCTAISLDNNFYNLGGNSLNSIYTVAKLHDRGYCIEITDFIYAKSLRKILKSMTEVDKIRHQNMNTCENVGDYIVEPVKMEHREEAIDMISRSFFEKSVLKQHICRTVQQVPKLLDYKELVNKIWPSVIEKGYSFIIKDKNDRLVGVSLNTDGNEEPDNQDEVQPPHLRPLMIILEFVTFLEKSIKNQLPNDKPILQQIVVSTHGNLNIQDSIMAVTFIENEVIRLAKEKQFCGILSTNTNALTQQLAQNVLGYDTMLDYQINQYVVDGIKPFATASDSNRVMVQWKEL